MSPHHHTHAVPNDVGQSSESDLPSTGGKRFIPFLTSHLLFHVLLFGLPEAADSLAASVASPPARKVSANQQSLSEQPASFPRTWVPLASTRELDPTRPTPVYFLNNRYVMYRSVISSKDDEEDQWMVLDDACPHRLAPLSQGRLSSSANNDDDASSSAAASSVVELECSYHGWRFDAEGKCTKIPQMSEAAQEKLLGAQKCHPTRYSTRIVNDVLFFWPWEEDCLSAMEDEWKQPEAMLNGVVPTGGTYTRDLPYGWEALVENIVDPSHVPFAHHGLQGTREDAIPINMTMLETVSAKGFRFAAEDRTMGQRRSIEGAFRAPYVIQYGGRSLPSERPFDLTALLIPTKPGWSRIMLLTQARSVNQKINDVGKEGSDTKEEAAPKPSIISVIFQNAPVWFIHQLSNVFLDSDLAFLHFQELEIQRRTSFDSFMPAEADTCIVAWRKWLKDYGIAYTGSDAQLTALPQSVLFDRHEQHTQHCRHCRAALEGAQSNRNIAVGGLIASILLWQLVEPLAQLGAITSIGVIAVTSVMEKWLREGGFDHATND